VPTGRRARFTVPGTAASFRPSLPSPIQEGRPASARVETGVAARLRFAAYPGASGGRRGSERWERWECWECWE